jgi:branched-chain amino acid transport system ATP-binding protein
VNVQNPTLNAQRSTLLGISNLVTGYGKKQVLNGVSLEVPAGGIVALIGHNGAGKSTLLKAVFGLLPVWQGSVAYDGRQLNGAKPRDLLRAGMAYIPQGNRVFTDLTVQENLQVGGVTLSNKQRLKEGIERALATFPILKERLQQRAGTLSGGEKQVLALANALVLSPRLLLLDEPSLGLAPQMVTEALDRIRQLNRDQGISMLIVEQKVREVLEVCHSVCCLKLGKVTYSGPPQELKSNPDKLRQVFL